MSDRAGSFDTHIAILYDILCHMVNVIKCHKMAFYDILWHLPYAIKYHKVWQYGYQMNRLDQKNWYMEFKSVGQEIFFAKIPKNWKTKFSFSEFLCILKLPWAMRIFALERNFLHFSTLLYARTNISYANFDCSKFCQMRYPTPTQLSIPTPTPKPAH